MAIKLGSNIASIKAQRRLADADTVLTRTFERLASGQRINRASDDAAGLAIADELKSKGRIYTQAIRNGNDGISLLNIADSAIDALSGVVARIRELSEQAANGSYSDNQRAAIDAEAQALSDEFSRITKTTSFNGINIFNGSLGHGLRLQLGVGISESINASIGGAIGTGEFVGLAQYSSETKASYALELADLNNDGILDLITAGWNDSNIGAATIRLGLGNGAFGAATTYSTEGMQSWAISVGDLNNDGNLDLVTAGYDAAFDGYATIRLGNGDGTFRESIQYTTEGSSSRAVKLGDLNGDGILDLVTAGYNATDGYASIRMGIGDGTFGSSIQYSTESNRSFALSLVDLNSDGILDLATTGIDNSTNDLSSIRLGNGDGTFGSMTQYSTVTKWSYALSFGDLNSDGILDMVTAGRDAADNGFATIRLGIGDGTFGSGVRYSTESFASTGISLGDLNGDGILDLVTAGYDDGFKGYVTVRLGAGNGSFGDQTRFSVEGYMSSAISLGDLNGDGVLDLATSGYETGSPAFNGKVSIRLAQTEDGLGALLDFSLQSRSEALKSIGMLDRTLENLAKQRGTIGASQSRINIAISSLESSRENFAAAESRIRDADVAGDAAELVRTQILQQAASAVLTQANQQPQLALQLLR